MSHQIRYLQQSLCNVQEVVITIVKHSFRMKIVPIKHLKEITIYVCFLYSTENPVQQVSGGAAAAAAIISQSDSYETISENSFKISNLPIASAPVIEELSPPRSSKIGTLPKINNSAVETNQKESNLIRELSSSQPHLNSSKTQANQSGAMSSRNNQSADSLPDTNQSNDEMNLGEKRDDFSSYPHLKIQNDVNEEGRSISAKDTKSSWRNITKSDDSFVHNHHESGNYPGLGYEWVNSRSLCQG